MDIYIRLEVDGAEVKEGPYSLRDVQKKLAEGSLQLTDLARYEGMLGKEYWVPLGDLPKVSISFQRKSGKEIHLSEKSASVLRRKNKGVRQRLAGAQRRKQGSAGFVYLLAFVGIVGTFLPWLEVEMWGSHEAIPGIGTSDGLAVLVLFLITIVACWVLSLRGAGRIFAMLASLAIAVICTVALVRFLYFGSGSIGKISMGFGFWIVYLMSLFLLVGAFLVTSNRKLEEPVSLSIPSAPAADPQPPGE